MSKREIKKDDTIKTVAQNYFEYMGRNLPQQCASDEFYFLPRSETAVRYLDRLDNFAPEKIQQNIQHVKKLLGEIQAVEKRDLESEIDRRLLKQSMESFLREYEDAKVWKFDPTLYVKIPLLATDHAISRRDGAREHVLEDLLALFAQIPAFLHLAAQNLDTPPETFIEIALNMSHDASRYYDCDVRAYIEEQLGDHRELIFQIGRVLDAWEAYKKALLHMPSRETFAVGEEGLGQIYTVSLAYSKSPEEILKTAREIFEKTRNKLHLLAGKIDNRRDWRQIIHDQMPAISSPSELMELYQAEVQNLRRFVYSQKLVTLSSGEEVTVQQTPSYLQSLRATASYKAPTTGDTGVSGIFYITPGKEDLQLIAGHCPYLSAHETYPGHHILDHLRVHHPNPIRRQIESPLYYEGWACYAEALLDEMGYIREPQQQLIGLQRRLWRNLRATLDVRLQTGAINMEQAAREIEGIGYSPSRAQRQVRRFALTPGYQSCYAMGMYEILRLREQFSSRLALTTFHDMFLAGGQLPFDLLEKRLEAAGVRREKS
ncbi:DUF885 family protein [Thermodesulfobacteriota bacterium]